MAEQMMTWRGGAVTDYAVCVLAPNPGPMTLDGTNTWVLRAPGSREAVVIDPGPAHRGHLEAVARHVEESDARVSLVLLTHGHDDHSGGAADFAAAVGSPVRAWDPAHRLGEEGVAEGDVIQVGGLDIAVVATPGHTSDSVTFVLPDAVLTGDTVLGRGTTVVAHPDGRLADYLDSLARLRDLVAERGAGHILPGHGPALADPVAAIDGYLAHRQDRLEQIRAALADLAEAGDLPPAAELPMALVRVVYADVPQQVWPAAELSVRAQLEYLAENG